MPPALDLDFYRRNFYNSLGSLFRGFYSHEELQILESEIYSKYLEVSSQNVDTLIYNPGPEDPLLRRQTTVVLIACNSMPFFASRLRKVFQLLRIDINRSLHFHPEKGREVYYLETAIDNLELVIRLREGIQSSYNRILKLTGDFKGFYRDWEGFAGDWDLEILELQRWLLDKSYVWEGSVLIRNGIRSDYGSLEFDERVWEWFQKLDLSNPKTYSNISRSKRTAIDCLESDLKSFLGDEKYYYIAFVTSSTKLLFIGSMNQFAKNSALIDIPFFKDKFSDFLSRENIEPFSGLGRTTRMMFNYVPTEIIFLLPEENYVSLHSATLEHSLKNTLRSVGVVLNENLGLIVSFIPETHWSESVYESSDRILQEIFPDALVRRYFVMRGNFVESFHIVRCSGITSQKIFDASSRLEFSFRTWMDHLSTRWEKTFHKPFPPDQVHFYEDYKATHTPDMCIYDLKLASQMGKEELAIAITNRTDTTVIHAITPKMRFVLSQWVRILSDMGLNPISQRVYHFDFKGKTLAKSEFFFHYFENKKNLYKRIQNLFYYTLLGEIRSDTLSELVLWSDLDENGIYLAKAIRDYCLQTNAIFNPDEFNAILVSHPELANATWRFFFNRFREGKNASFEEILHEADKGKTIREDMVLKAYATAFFAILRTNFFGIRGDERVGLERDFLSFKIDSSIPSSLPSPRPYRETFVYSSCFQGIHLRGGPVARGGIRWSDRLSDYRTELLGLLKTQMVKNSIIVPVGSKGSFVLTPNTLLKKEISMVEAYKGYISGLLELVDNRKKGEILSFAGSSSVPYAYDGPDPYLVVAADKGTAQLSDTANDLSEAYKFWLGDAFASGGSKGYSHKKYGITAKGALTTADRNLRMAGFDFRNEPITVVGIGDMGGDVFGNGLLESRHFRLVACFNHKHIFIDPNPDPEISYEERKRLFFSEASGWDFYDLGLLSRGGGIWNRTEKSIPISPEARQVLGISTTHLSGNELIQAILKAPVHLLYNGGIGTYVKASAEENSKVGDPANNDVRVDAKDLRCTAVCEGGNLGFTQLARMEYDSQGGYIFTDAIDNSAGVDLSDHEVNLKILFNELIDLGKISSMEERNELLLGIDSEVVDSVLINNSLQSLAINADRYASELQGEACPRPTLANRLGELKMELYELCLRAEVFPPEDFPNLYLGYFPPKIQNLFSKELFLHPLKLEISTTRAVNFLVNLMGTNLPTLFPESRDEVPRFLRKLLEFLESKKLPKTLDSLALYRDKSREREVLATVLRIRSAISENWQKKKDLRWLEPWKGILERDSLDGLREIFQ